MRNNFRADATRRNIYKTRSLFRASPALDEYLPLIAIVRVTLQVSEKNAFTGRT